MIIEQEHGDLPAIAARLVHPPSAPFAQTLAWYRPGLSTIVPRAGRSRDHRPAANGESPGSRRGEEPLIWLA
jgi:hypothetical protein